MKKETAIEVKVGALVLFSLVVLAAFVLVLGDFSVSDGFGFEVEFDNAGGLKPGADVAIAGINVGTVEELRFIKNERYQQSPDASAVAVRALLLIDEEYAEAIRTSSDFYITTRGVLGEQYIEIVTQNFDAPPVEPGAVLHGVNPPRMDLIIAKGTRLLTLLTDLLDNPEIEVKELLSATTALVKNINDLLEDNRQPLDNTVRNVETMTSEAAELTRELNAQIGGEDQQIASILANLQQTTRHSASIARKVDGQVEPLIDEARQTARSASAVAQKAEGLLERNEGKIDRALTHVEIGTEALAASAKDAQAVTARLERGEGTVGNLLADREIYDDLKELLRVIKRQPWKMIWKE